jgi:hypothetical protein
MLKKVAIVYILVAALVAIVTTFMQVQPALFFIELFLDDDHTFPLTFTMLITLFVLLLPLILVLVIVRLMQKGNDPLPDLTGKTGVLVRRERLLSNGFYTDNIIVDGEKKASVANGKSAFIELIPGSYKIFVKGSTTASPVLDLVLASGQRVNLKTGYRPEGLKTTQFLEADQI